MAGEVSVNQMDLHRLESALSQVGEAKEVSVLVCGSRVQCGSGL